MSSGQTPVEYQLHKVGKSGSQAMTAVQAHQACLDNLMMHQQQAQAQALRKQTPQTDSIDRSQFDDFSFHFQGASNAPILGANHEIDAKLEPTSDIYTTNPKDSISDHHGSVRTGRASFSSQAPLQTHNSGSVDECKSETPESGHGGAISNGEGYDEFGLNGPMTGDGSDLGSKNRDDKNEHTPAWSELKTKAGKERKRLPLACIACRRKKIRCSGEKPACKHCIRSRIPCVYKVTTRKAAPRTDYMAMLDKRLKRMEERIIKIVPKDELDLSAVVRAQVKPGIPGNTPIRNSKKRPAQEAFGSELDTWAKSNTSIDTGIANSLLTQEAEETKLLTEGAEALPTQEIQEHLAEVYFDNLYGQSYHLLHKPSFMRKLRASQLPPVLILAVCAVSARCSTHPKLNTNPAFLRGEQWASEARNIVMKRYEWPNITILTCLLLLGLHEFGTCYGGRSWALGGMAIRMAYALQLHQDLDHDPSKQGTKTPLSFIDREIRRRTMWACFLMDRFNSSGTDRPMFIKEEAIKVQLPIKEKFFRLDMEGPTEYLRGNVLRPTASDEVVFSDPKENMGVAAYIIRSIALWGRVILYLFQGGREMDPHPVWHPQSKYLELEKQVVTFVSGFPDSIKYTKENLDTHETQGEANQFLFLHIAAQQNILFLSHIAIQGHPGGRSPKGIPQDFYANNTTRAFEAGKRISELISDAEPHAVRAPFAGYCAFLSSTVQMTAAFSKNPAVEALAKKNLAINVRYIAKMKRFWGAFHWTSENLKDQFRACAETAKQGGSGTAKSATKAPSSISQYGDWFDRYPHGVSQSDFEDPATEIKKEKGDDAVLEQKSDYHTVEEFFHSLSPQQAPTYETSGPPSKQPRRKATKKSQAAARKDDLGAPGNVNVKAMASNPQNPQLMMQHPNMNQVPQCFHQQQQVSPTSASQNQTMYDQQGTQNYYGQDLLFTPQPQGMVPQLDRQLVFGAYGGIGQGAMDGIQGMDVQNLDEMRVDGMNVWGMAAIPGLTGTSGYAVEPPTSAWFMPFNMGPPEVDQDGLFDNLAMSNNAGYGVAGMMNQPDGSNHMDGPGGT